MKGWKDLIIMTDDYAEKLNRSIKEVIRDASLSNIFDIRFLSMLIRVRHRHKESAKLRAENFRNGTAVPAVLILSVTKQCNLNCTGCYANNQRPPNVPVRTPGIRSRPVRDGVPNFLFPRHLLTFSPSGSWPLRSSKRNWHLSRMQYYLERGGPDVSAKAPPSGYYLTSLRDASH